MDQDLSNSASVLDLLGKGCTDIRTDRQMAAMNTSSSQEWRLSPNERNENKYDTSPESFQDNASEALTDERTDGV